MTRPSAFTSYLGNYIGDTPDQSSWRSGSVPQDKAWAEAFFAADPKSRPTLVAYRGYRSDWGPYFYMDDQGDWRNTVDDSLWDGVKN